MSESGPAQVILDPSRGVMETMLDDMELCCLHFVSRQESGVARGLESQRDSTVYRTGLFRCGAPTTILLAAP